MGELKKCEKCGQVHYSKSHTCEKKGKIDSKWLVRGDIKAPSVGDKFSSQ